LFAKISAEELGKPVPADAKATFKALGDQMLDRVKKQDPVAYCPYIVGAMRSITADSLRRSIEAQFTRYEQKAKESKEAKEAKDTKTTPDK
jgi:hypothetical protein